MILIEFQNNNMIVLDRETNKSYVLPFNSVFKLRNKFPHLRKRPIVVGFVGPRGSGKSVGTSRMVILDHLLEGKKAWSNMDISCYVKNNGHSGELHTKDWQKLELAELDTIYEDGCLIIEEANMTMMEARRAMREENLKFSYILQQLRKRKLDLIWNAQSEMHVDPRLRFQTDIFIKCTDVSLLPKHHNVGVGELTLCKYYDFSGIVTGQISVNRGFIEPFWQGVFANKPWWNSFSTWQLQGMEEETEEEVNPFIEITDEIERYILDAGGRVKKDEIWGYFGIEDDLAKMHVGKLLSKKHIRQNQRRTHFQVQEVYEKVA